MNNTLDVESSRGYDNTHKTFDLVEVLTHYNIHIIVYRNEYNLY